MSCAMCTCRMMHTETLAHISAHFFPASSQVLAYLRHTIAELSRMSACTHGLKPPWILILQPSPRAEPAPK